MILERFTTVDHIKHGTVQRLGAANKSCCG
jgi:hypothetical protein